MVTAQIEKKDLNLSLIQILTVIGFVVPIGTSFVWNDEWDEKIKFKTRGLMFSIGIISIVIISIIAVFEGSDFEC